MILHTLLPGLAKCGQHIVEQRQPHCRYLILFQIQIERKKRVSPLLGFLGFLGREWERACYYFACICGFFFLLCWAFTDITRLHSDQFNPSGWVISSFLKITDSSFRVFSMWNINFYIRSSASLLLKIETMDVKLRLKIQVQRDWLIGTTLSLKGLVSVPLGWL